MEGLYSLANPPPRKGPPEDWPKWSTGWEIAYRFPLFRGVGPLTSKFRHKVAWRIPKWAETWIAPLWF